MASTSSQTPSSCSVSYTMAPPTSENLTSSTSSPGKWDVFLSYRGEDTRYIFTDHLYNALVRQGIRAFRDDPEIGTGELISDALFEAIRESKIYVIVFSENYASSRWCLDELVEIYKCYETMQRSVIAVYYNIEPSVVRYQSDSFEKAFEKHASRSNISKEQVENWRLTLKSVAEFSGITIVAKRSEADIINEIVEKVVKKIIPKSLPLPKYAVGLDSPVERIRSMLSSDSRKGVTKIGIYGMRGAGKTTLAKAVYNEHHLNFHGSCFLANVREKGLEFLQKKLINDILKSKDKVRVDSVDEGTMLVRVRICFAKILVVLDDVDDYTQFDSLVGPFAPGSVVIITTANKDLLVKSDVNPEHTYLLNELNDAESRTLFTQHAFRNEEPDKSLKALSKDILCHAGGLPLALEIFGSSLYKKTDVRWLSFTEELKRNPNTNILKRLAISLDAVDSADHMLKKIFIDIACFFIGTLKNEAVEILETYYPHTDDKIDRLKESCLLTINDKDELEMHGLLQDMGKDIARNNSPDEPKKHSRLWLEEDIDNILKNQKGTEVIECMIPQKYYVHTSEESFSRNGSFSAETFKRMTKLRFLYLNGVNLTGSFYQTFEGLRWLCWTCCPLECLPSDFCPEKLVALLLTYSSMRTLWDLNKVAPVFGKLKTLNMAYSQNLTTTPDFTNLPCLETLDFVGCESLQEIHISIGSLVRLVFLYLNGCPNLPNLPDSICNLRALKRLDIDHCTSLEALPIDLGNIESLKQLNAEGLGISELPDSIGKFSNLIELSLGHYMNGLYRYYTRNNLRGYYPRSPYNYLELSSRYRKFETLPDTICGLRALEVLNIIDYRFLKALPMDLGNIKSLKKINAAGLNVSKLPNSIGCLGNLVELILSRNKSLETLPNTICRLRGLKVLNVDNCSSLQALPTDLGNIESLEYLYAKGLTLSRLPNSIGKLSKLISLILSESRNLKTLPDTICNLGSLEFLDISSCVNLETLPDKLWKLPRLRKLDAHRATMLNKIPDIESSHSALSLETLILSETLLTALPSGIGQLSKLTYLCLKDCLHLRTISELPPNLTRIDASGCKYMESIPSLSHMKQLEVLNLDCCENLKEIQGLEGLTSLKKLFVRFCYSLHKDTFTEGFFQRCSGLGHVTTMHAHCIPRWFSRTSELGSSVSLDLPLASWPNFLGLIMCFDLSQSKFSKLEYSVKTATDFMDSGSWLYRQQGILMIIIPRSIFCVRDGDDKIELKTNFEFSGIHLLYKTEITMIDEKINKIIFQAEKGEKGKEMEILEVKSKLEKNWKTYKRRKRN